MYHVVSEKKENKKWIKMKKKTYGFKRVRAMRLSTQKSMHSKLRLEKNCLGAVKRSLKNRGFQVLFTQKY